MTTKGSLEPFRLRVHFAERVWGRESLAPWYAGQYTKPVGEAWLTGGVCVVETGPHAGATLTELVRHFPAELLGSDSTRTGDGFPLLVKMLFPREKLSIQVHPDDDDAAAMGGDTRSKTECWYVLKAEPGASVSLGLKTGTTEQMVRESLGCKSFEDLLHHESVAEGEMIFVEAGTVHAIGAGLVLLEVQQTSDTTFRLYDYGRPRELHLEDGMKVIKLRNASGRVSPKPLPQGSRLIETRCFVVDRFDLSASGPYQAEVNGRPECLVGLEGSSVLVSRDVRLDLPAGQAVVLPAQCGAFAMEGSGTFLRCSLPQS